MAWLAVNKDGTEIISDYTLHRNGHGKTQSDLSQMARVLAIETLSFWDTFEYGPNNVKFDLAVRIPKGTIKKLIGRDLVWEDEPQFIDL